MGLPGKSVGFVLSRKGILSAQWFLATLDEHCQTSTSLQILIYNSTSSNIKHQTSKHYPENHVYYFLRQLHCVPFPTPLFESQKRLIFCILCLVFLRRFTDYFAASTHMICTTLLQNMMQQVYHFWRSCVSLGLDSWKWHGKLPIFKSCLKIGRFVIPGINHY